MSSTRTTAAKKTTDKTKPEEVAEMTTPVEPQQPEQDPAVEVLLNAEQEKLNAATVQAQLGYLSQRIAELTKENYDLRTELSK